MKTPTHVIFECTPTHYGTKVYSGPELIADNTNVMESAGASKSTDGDCWWDKLPNHEELADRIDSVGLNLFGVSGQLYKLHEDSQLDDCSTDASEPATIERPPCIGTVITELIDDLKETARLRTEAGNPEEALCFSVAAEGIAEKFNEYFKSVRQFKEATE